jgi:hypothetical protein
MLTFNIIIAKKGREKTKQYQLPQSWEEYKNMGLDTLEALQTILTYPNTVAKLKILKNTLKLPKATFNRLSDTDLAAIIAQLDWMTLDATPEPFVTEFIHNETTYILPRSRFENGTALEYAIAEDYFKKITPDNDEVALINLCATLCREKTKDTATAISAGDHRIPLTSRGEVEHRAEAFKTLDPYIQVAVFLYFSGVKKFIFDTYGQAIFAQPEETALINLCATLCRRLRRPVARAIILAIEDPGEVENGRGQIN